MSVAASSEIGIVNGNPNGSEVTAQREGVRLGKPVRDGKEVVVYTPPA
jgi:hypothetical protein